MKDAHQSLSSRLFVFLFLSAIVFSVYANTFQASWHLDDRPNILNNYYLHLDSLDPEKLIQTLFTDPRNPEQLRDRPYRPVACLTFALNWYFGKDNVIGYHIVNTGIHVLTACVLFLFILQLFHTPDLRDKSRGKSVIIAALASLMWAVHPIQTQTVTYIVQRMAQLAALFYILGLYAYLKARLSRPSAKRVIWMGWCLICYLLAVNSKPNAAMMPLSVLFLEIAFFQNLSDRKTRKTFFLATFLIAILIVFSGSILFLKGNPLSFLDLYRSRPFTLTERLLTQPRVIIFYLSQLFYPLPQRFSIDHDIAISVSLFEPWTTLPSILILVFMLGYSIVQIRRRPILCFALLFFFLNHIIESSVIGLELIFEHRNYLPSLFLFLPIAFGLNNLAVVYQQKNRAVSAAIIVFVMFIVCFFSVSSYLRNRVWKDDITLWMDAVKKAPNSARASSILAIKLAWGDHSQHPRRYDMALKLLEESLKKNLPRNDVKAGIYGNMALIYFHKKGEPQKALEYFGQALKIDPGNLKIRRELVEALTLDRNFDAALEQVNILLSRNKESGRYLNLKGHVLLWRGDYVNALACFQDAYPLLARKNSVLLNSAVALSLAGHYSKADVVLVEAIERFPADMTFYFAAIENSIRANSVEQAGGYAKKMAKIFTIREINEGIENFTNNPQYAPLNARPIWLALGWLKSNSPPEN